MAGPQDEIDALTEQVAKLTARVYQLERRAGVQANERPEGARETPVQGAVATPTEAAPEPPSAVTVPSERPEMVAAPIPVRGTPTGFQPAIDASLQAQDANLEKKIGQYWLNRIGIVAILVGVSYFLKYAFENNWIGPAGA